MIETSHYDLVNKNGTPICHAVKCRKRKVIKTNNGLFCGSHARQLSYIRHALLYAKKLKLPILEIEMRQRELEFRKVFHEGHIVYLNKLTESNCMYY